MAVNSLQGIYLSRNTAKSFLMSFNRSDHSGNRDRCSYGRISLSMVQSAAIVDQAACSIAANILTSNPDRSRPFRRFMPRSYASSKYQFIHLPGSHLAGLRSFSWRLFVFQMVRRVRSRQYHPSVFGTQLQFHIASGTVVVKCNMKRLVSDPRL